MKKILLLLVFALQFVYADATIEIVKRMEKLPTIGLLDGSGPEIDSGIKRRFFQMLVGDLKVSTHFDVIDDYYKDEGGSALAPFVSKRPDLIMRYKIESESNGEIVVRVKLLNAISGTTRLEKSFKVSHQNRYPFLAHRIIVEINDILGFPSIAWMERFVIFAKYTTPKESEIIISDYTLSFQESIVKGGLNIFPKWSNRSQDGFYYSDYNGRIPAVYYVELSSGKRTKLLESEGMMMVSDVSSDGQRLLVTMAPNDQPDIYMYTLRNRALEQITDYRGIDVSAGFVDNDMRIVFVSDRLGYPNIFTKNIGSSSVTQMVYHGRNNNSVSAFDKYMVYSSREKSSEFGSGTFNLYLISTQTDFIRQLSATGKNLFPRFSPDGESILYIKEYGAQSALGIIRLGANKSFHFPLKVGHIQSIDW